MSRAVVLALFAVLAPMTLAAADEPARPNILLIVADDMGFSGAGCYGGEIATPNLDALARDGLRFTQFYNTARCWPSRAAILTGYYAQQVRRDTVPGVRSGTQGTRLPWARLLPELLRPLGYRSYHSGKWHVDGKPLQNGFDHSYSLNDHDRHFTPRQHTEDDRPLPPVEARDGTVEHDSFWWLHEGNRALRAGNWKVVAAGKDSPWELYDLSSDRPEGKDRAKDRPEKVRELVAIWTKQFEEYSALAARDLPPARPGPASAPGK
jgi:arylsulfatase A-like enzyme